MIPIEGAVASPNPRATVLAGSLAFRVAENALALGRFAWGDAVSGLVRNTRASATDRLGFALSAMISLTSVYVERGVRYARPGVGVTLMSAGDFWARFPYGASIGQRVYASIVDGAAISGEANDSEATPWTVATNASPGGLAIISTTFEVSA